MGGACSTHESYEKCIEHVYWGNLKGKDHSEDLDVDWKIILEWMLGKCNGKAWTGFIWLRIGTSGGALVNKKVMKLRGGGRGGIS
jgi:hypothetical protein